MHETKNSEEKMDRQCGKKITREKKVPDSPPQPAYHFTCNANCPNTLL